MKQTKLVGFKKSKKGEPSCKLKQLNAQESKLNNKVPGMMTRNVWKKKQKRQQGRKQKKRS